MSKDVGKGRTLEGNSQATGDRDVTGRRAPSATPTQIHFTLHTAIETEEERRIAKKNQVPKSQPGLRRSLYVSGSRDREGPPSNCLP